MAVPDSSRRRIRRSAGAFTRLHTARAERASWLAGLIAEQDRTLMGAAWRETMAFDSGHRLAEIACPALILAASDDRAVPIHHARTLLDGIPRSQLVIIDDADHALIWTHPDKFLRVIDEALGA